MPVRLSSKWTTSIVNRQLERQGEPLGRNRMQERQMCRDQLEMLENSAVVRIIVRGSQDHSHRKEVFRGEEVEQDREGESEGEA